MAEVNAFAGLRYNQNSESGLRDLVTPPYDIISAAGQDGYYAKNEKNVIRLEFGKAYEGDGDKENKYTRAKAALDEWMRAGTLKLDEKPAFYIYEQVFASPSDGVRKAFKGLFSAVKLEEFSKGIILPHEETLSKAKTDRFSLMDATNCNFSPIYLLYLDGGKKAVNIVDRNSSGKPALSFVSEDGITQNLWIVDDEKEIGEIENAFTDKQLFIADGHHRYETALNYRDKKRAEGVTGGGYDYVMSFLVEMDNDGLLVFPTHRMLKNLAPAGGFSEEDTVKKLSDEFYIEKIDGTDIEDGIKPSANEKIFGFYTGKDYYYKVTLKDNNAMSKYLPEKSGYYRNLDVSILHTMILEKFFGIDKENMANQTNLYYTRSYKEAVESVRNGEYQCSFIINATKIREIKDVSLSGEKMPQKSTYFWPKLVTGIVMRKFD
jgi:uncharacterized protein (DUF1015 family)